MNKVHFSSKTDVWETPQALFEELNREFRFETDVCALLSNAKCDRFFSPETDGLSQEWLGRCWCNPPYGRQIGKWVKKAATSEALTVMLLPARTDTAWFHDYCLGREIRFIRGRIKFGGGEVQCSLPKHDRYFRREEA